MKNLFCIALIFIACNVHAQTVLLQREVEDYGIDSTNQNSSYEYHSNKGTSTGISGISFPATQSEDGAEIENLPSIQLTYGLLYKYAFTKAVHVGAALTYDYFNYRIQQNEDKILPVAYQSNKETIRMHAIDGGIFFRINYVHSDDGPGKYVDLGANALWIFGSNHRTWNDGADETIIKIKTRKLPYVEPLQYMATARIGFGILAFNVSYRLSNVFKESYNYPELPKINIGIVCIIDN